MTEARRGSLVLYGSAPYPSEASYQRGRPAALPPGPATDRTIDRRRDRRSLRAAVGDLGGEHRQASLNLTSCRN